MPPAERRGTPWILTAIGGVAMLVLLIGFAVWIGSRDDEVATSSTIATTTLASTTTTQPTTTQPATTVEATTSLPTTIPTTVPATTLPATTLPEPPSTTLPSGPSGDSWTITSPYFPDDPFTLERVAQVERLSAYDGAIDAPPTGVRCVAIVVDGADEWNEWCAEPGQAVIFVTLDGIDPWLVEVGAEPGDVTLTRREPTWTLPSNGCTAPMTSLLASSPTGGPGAIAVMTGITCLPGEAFVSIGSVLLQPGPADGGGALFLEGDEGWDTAGFGTSFDCEGWSDGVDRCELYGVEFELFEALLPVPPNDVLTTSTDITAMRDETPTVLAWIGGETDPAVIDTIIVDQLTDPEAEVPPNISRADDIGYWYSVNLLIVEVPAMDDSILSTTWAVWIGTASATPSVQTFAWETCARGLDQALDLCV